MSEPNNVNELNLIEAEVTNPVDVQKSKKMMKNAHSILSITMEQSARVSKDNVDQVMSSINEMVDSVPPETLIVFRTFSNSEVNLIVYSLKDNMDKGPILSSVQSTDDSNIETDDTNYNGGLYEALMETLRDVPDFDASTRIFIVIYTGGEDPGSFQTDLLSIVIEEAGKIVHDNCTMTMVNSGLSSPVGNTLELQCGQKPITLFYARTPPGIKSIFDFLRDQLTQNLTEERSSVVNPEASVTTTTIPSAAENNPTTIKSGENGEIDVLESQNSTSTLGNRCPANGTSPVNTENGVSPKTKSSVMRRLGLTVSCLMNICFLIFIFTSKNPTFFTPSSNCGVQSSSLLWVPGKNGHVTTGSLEVGAGSSQQKIYVARTCVDGKLVVGKLVTTGHNNAAAYMDIIGNGLTMDTYETLVVKPEHVDWIPYRNGRKILATPISAGKGKNGEELVIGRYRRYGGTVGVGTVHVHETDRLLWLHHFDEGEETLSNIFEVLVSKVMMNG